MSKPIQYLLVGLPYSGKTTLAKHLKEKHGFAHINIDQLKIEAGYGDVGDDDVPDHIWDEIFTKADQLIVKYLKEGKNLANEYAWVTREWRDRARRIARQAGFDTKLIYLDIPHSEVKRRWQENLKTNQRFHWPEHEFQQYINDFEQPIEDENIIIYDQTTPVDDWIKQNLSDK
jgi:predicted kinase